jgi:hypothetical protein
LSAAEKLSDQAALTVIPASAISTIVGADKNDILGQLASKVAAHKPDISTIRGRKEIASLAAEVASAKMDLIRLGKSLTEGWRKSTAAVNAECKVIEERMDALKAEVRAPLTEFEEREKRRIAAHERAIEEITISETMLEELSPAQMREFAETIRRRHAEREWEEFTHRAAHAIGRSLPFIEAFARDVEAEEARVAEANRLRLIAEEEARVESARLQAEREAKIAEEAATAAREKAEREAAEAARLAAERVEQERREAEDARLQAEIAAQQEIDALEAERARVAEEARAAEDRARRAEEARVAAERRAENERVAAEKREQAAAASAARDAEAVRIQNEKAAEHREAEALRAERRRVAAEKEAGEREAAARAADRENKAAIHRDILADLVGAAGINAEQGRRVIEEIARGHVRHVRIEY